MLLKANKCAVQLDVAHAHYTLQVYNTQLKTHFGVLCELQNWLDLDLGDGPWNQSHPTLWN